VPTEVPPPVNPTNTATVIPFDILTDTPDPQYYDEGAPTEQFTQEVPR
jgi:hypothetical protein